MRALEAQLPGIIWMRLGATLETEPRYEVLSFDTPHVLSIPTGESLIWLDQQLDALPADEPEWCGYAVALHYEAGALCDDAIAADNRMRVPVAQLVRLDAVYVLDCLSHTACLQFSPDATEERIANFSKQIQNLCVQPPQTVRRREASVDGDLQVCGEMSRGDYEATVSALKSQILAGDFYEVNLTQHFQISSHAHPDAVALSLFADGAARHARNLDLGKYSVISNSPEQFLRIHQGKIETCPIKGSSKRSAEPEADARSHSALARSVKDHAEHTMVVDMSRNDLGRICKPGSISVTSGFLIESHRDLHHLVSTVEGELRDRKLPISEILRATFPAASITGAPKIAAIRAIRDIERSPRGIYTGALGFVGRDRIDLNVAIRTITATHFNGSYVYEFGAGGAVVADSNSAEEYWECLTKARALYNAIQTADHF
ncbi:MAG: anthranilate synthase component I family protein [Candidatus Sumerlaeaceae bacterium]